MNTAAGATWVSIHHGGGTGIGYSQHAGMVVVADGTPSWPRQRWSGCSRPTPAWASCATPTRATSAPIEVARERGVHVPMLDR